jgi:hypothetical protein
LGILDAVGDVFEVAVDVVATLDEAPRLAGTVIEWLTVEGIIDAAPTDDRDVWGAGYYQPGPNHLLAAADPDHPYATGLVESGLARLKVVIGRMVFCPVQGEPGPAVCPLCGYAVTLTDPDTGRATQDWELFSEALGNWHSGGPGTVACPNNGSPIGINEWHWQGDWPIAVGHLGFEFWNWPILSTDFTSRIASRLGHRVVITRGTL